MYKDTEREKLNNVYKWAKARCNNPNVKQYQDYGGRGIEFRFTSFQEFLEELGPRPTGFMLDRIDNNGHYEIGNVRWATRQDQNNNKRVYRANKFGRSGLTELRPTGRYRTTRYVVRVVIDGKRVELYKGPDLSLACYIWDQYYATQTK